MTDLPALAERALAAAGSGEALASVTRERSLLLRFARSRPTQATAVDDLAVEIAVVRDGHVGRAQANSGDPDALAACAGAARAAAEAAARSAGVTGAFPGFPAPAPARAHDGFDLATAALDPRAGGAALATAFARSASAGVEANGVWTAGDVERALATSRGARVARDRVTDAFMKVTAIAPASGRSGYAAGTARASDDLDAGALAGRAAAKAAHAGEPLRLPPGEYPIVLEPDAVGDLLAWLGALAFDGLAHTDGRGALAGRLGSRVAAARINLSDSPRFARTLPRAFDEEGVPKAPLPLVQDGVAHRVVHDTRSAALAGGSAASTGHALAPGGAPEGPRPTNLVLIGGGCADEAELCLPVERGVYVTRLWYTNPVRPKEALVTGMTRDGTFLIEDGELTRPLEDMRLTDSILAILDGCEELSARPRLVSDGEFYGRRFATGVVCPALRSSARFTA